MAWFDRYIERTEGVQGGYPVIRGTRTPVRSVVVLYEQTYGLDLAAVRHALPHLSTREIDAALAYYLTHRALVDEDIERQRKALNQFAAAR